MMAALFLIYLVALIFMIGGMRKAAIWLAVINIVLCALLFWHHVTIDLPIRL